MAHQFNSDVLIRVIKQGEGEVRVRFREAPKQIVIIGERQVKSKRLNTNGRG